MIELLDKRVRIKASNGKIFEGVIIDYLSPEDNDGEESIIMECDDNSLIEFYRQDISEIVEV